jgi:hypothetical protein
MTGIPAIRVNDEKNVVDYSTDRLDSDLAIFTTIIQPLQCGTQEDARVYSKPKPRSLRLRRLLASSHSKSIVECTL